MDTSERVTTKTGSVVRLVRRFANSWGKLESWHRDTGGHGVGDNEIHLPRQRYHVYMRFQKFISVQVNLGIIIMIHKK